MPFIYDIGCQYELSSNKTGGLIDDATTMKLNSVFVNEALRSVGSWTLNARISGESYYDWINIYNSIAYIFSGFILVIIGIITFVSKNKKGINRKLSLLMLSMLILGILLNSGFKSMGFLNNIVNYIFSSDYLVRAFRSIYLKFGILLIFPISFLAGYSFDSLKIKNKKNEMFVLIIFCFSFLYFMARPFLNGQIIKKMEGALISSFAISIPDDYYYFKSKVENVKLDGRYLSLPIPKSYNLSLKWEDKGFQGADFLRFFLNKPLIFMNEGGVAIKIIANTINEGNENYEKKLYGLMGIDYFFIHKDLNKIYSDTYLTKKDVAYLPINAIYTSIYFEVAKIKNDFFLPHFHIPQKSIISQRTIEDLPKIISSDDWQTRSVVFFADQNTEKENILNKLKTEKTTALPTLEFKKINPTKYRVRVHNASGVFPLVFSESFHEKWKAYLAKNKMDSRLRGKDNLENYKILDKNEENQANINELQNYIDNGYVTTLGDLQEKTIKHTKWNSEQQKEELDYEEKYNIDFISKNFQGTIQNDNLPDGNLTETWFQKPIENSDNHLIANGYANSWVIDPNKICETSPQPSPYQGEGISGCVKNSDGSYDFEIIVEFWPQRLFYLGLFISGMMLLTCLGYLIWNYKKNAKIF